MIAAALIAMIALPALSAPEPPPLRRITHHLIEALDPALVTPALPRAPPLSCLGEPVHAPWDNPYSPLPPALRSRHVRMTLAAADAVVELRDAFLVEAPRTLAFELVPDAAPRLELAYRLYGCHGPNGDVTLRVRTIDALGTWQTELRLHARRPARSERDAFLELALDLPLSAGQPARLELELVPARGGDGVLVALAEPVLTGVAPGPATAADTNVLWIVIDSVRGDAMGPGRAFSPSVTPAIDRHVFERGTAFAQAHALSNQTRTSTVGMLASLPPSIGGFHSNAWAFTSGRRETFYASDPPLVTRALARAGFRVVHFGHNHFLWASEVIGLDHGFSRAVDFRGIPSDAVLASAEAIRFVQRRADERWFMMLNYTAPHTPYRAPDDFDARAREMVFTTAAGATFGPDERVGFLPRSYLGELLWVDHNLAAVFAELDRLELTERTLIIVTADHGEVMNPAHDCASALFEMPCGFNHSLTVYDDELVVPLALALPTRIAAGHVVTTPVSHADLPRTILALLGLSPSPRHVGRSLVPALARHGLPEVPIYADGRLASALRLGDWKLIVHAAQDDIRPRARMIAGEPARFELFDLAADPLETDNLAARHRDVLALMRAELDGVRLALRTRFERGHLDEQALASLAADLPDSVADNHLMLVADDRPRRLRGRVSAHGAVACVAPPIHTAPPACVPDGDGAVLIDLEVPAGTTHTLSLTTSPWSAPLDLTLTLDDVPVPADRLRIGPWGLCLLPPGGRFDRADHLALAIAEGTPLPQPREAAVYFWRSAPTPSSAPIASLHTSPEHSRADPSADEALGGEVKKILQDLGYTR